MAKKVELNPAPEKKDQTGKVITCANCKTSWQLEEDDHEKVQVAYFYNDYNEKRYHYAFECPTCEKNITWKIPLTKNERLGVWCFIISAIILTTSVIYYVW